MILPPSANNRVENKAAVGAGEPVVELISFIFSQRSYAISCKPCRLIIAVIFPNVPQPTRKELQIVGFALFQEDFKQIANNALLAVLLSMQRWQANHIVTREIFQEPDLICCIRFDDNSWP